VAQPMFVAQNNVSVSIFLRKQLDEMSKCLLVQLVITIVPQVAQLSVVCHARCRLLHLNQTCLHLFLNVFTTSYSIFTTSYSLFQTEFSKECNLLLSLSVYSTLSFPSGNPVGAYVLFPLSRHFYLSFR